MPITIIYPFSPLNEKEADGPFQEEYVRLKQMAFSCALFDYDLIECGIFNPKPGISSGDIIIYRGWMLTPASYKRLSDLVESKGGKMLTSPAQFVMSHHIVGWYENLKTFSPESRFFENENDIEIEAEKLGWGRYFVKDYVKSNYDSRGSIANSAQEVKEIIDLIRAHRGHLEGGIALRKVEYFKQETEVRYFVFKGNCYSPDGHIPEIVKHIATLHTPPFYSVDIIENINGQFRLIEIGDGQVSDRKIWSAESFCRIFSESNLGHTIYENTNAK